MAHRGRFPIMLSILDYPPADLFRKIMGRSDMPEEYTAGVLIKIINYFRLMMLFIIYQLQMQNYSLELDAKKNKLQLVLFIILQR